MVRVASCRRTPSTRWTEGAAAAPRARGFTLVEVMSVVAIVGVLAVLAITAYRRWVKTAYVAEAQDMVSNIRTAEESFRAENGGYLNVSRGLGPGNDYPATSGTPGKFKTSWGGQCTVCSAGVSWASLNIQPNAPLAFGYSVVASNTTLPSLPPVSVNGKPLDISAMTIPWYFIEADGDEDGNSVFTKVYGMSATNTIFIDNEGE